MHLAKQNPDFWRYIARKERVELEKIYFVDDNRYNIAVANELGIKTHHFKDADALRSELKALKLLGV